MVAPKQYSLVVTDAKVGVSLLFIVIVNVAVVAHTPDEGVKV